MCTETTDHFVELGVGVKVKPSKRLGASQGEAEVLNEPFFESLDLDALKQGKLEPPTIPKVSSFPLS